VDGTGELVSQRLMNGALARESGHAGESLGNDNDAKMALTARAGAGMPGVLARLVEDLEPPRLKSGLELVADLLGDTHIPCCARPPRFVKCRRGGHGPRRQLQGICRVPILSAVRYRNRHIPLSGFVFEDSDDESRCCDHPACQQAGEYRAPKSKTELNAYFWFCLEHVRAYNASWDFFRGMSQAEIECFQRESVIGHRPTWRMGAGFAQATLNGVKDPFGLFANGKTRSRTETRDAKSQVDPKRRRALAVLNLEASANLQEIKMRYKQLVKRYHPDANGGDKSAEERFKSISEAYSFLQSNGAV